MSDLRARYSDLELSSPLAPSAKESFCISCHERGTTGYRAFTAALYKVDPSVVVGHKNAE